MVPCPCGHAHRETRLDIVFDAAGWQIVDQPGARQAARTGTLAQGATALECNGKVLGLPLCECGAAGPDRWQACYRTRDWEMRRTNKSLPEWSLTARYW